MPALAYINSPFTTMQDVANQVVTNINSTQSNAAPFVQGTAVAGAVTAQGLKLSITTEALATAAAATYTLTITDASIAVNSLVFVTVNFGTSTTGEPGVHLVTPAAGSVVFKIRNDAAAAAFNGTLVVGVLVIN